METRGVYLKPGAACATIRPDCLISLPGPWEPPVGEELAAALSMAGLSATAFAGLVGVEPRTVRRWLRGDSSIPYAAWAWLAARAGLAEMWRPWNDGLPSTGSRA